MTERSAPAKRTGTPGPLVLLIEDESSHRRYLRPSLIANGYRFLEAAKGGEGLELAAQYVPDVVLLDLGLPDIDGLDVTRRLRQWSTAPIIILSARGQEADKIAALDAGADDYLTKPFGFGELLARIRVTLRRAARLRADQASTEYASGPLRVDLAARRVFIRDNEVHLTAIEYRLLAELIQQSGRLVTHRQLLHAVWGPGHAAHTEYVRVYMAHLRRKLGDDPARPRVFQTEIGVGYRLIGPDDARA